MARRSQADFEQIGDDMAYAIMRAKKLANMGSVAASMQHCYRERDTHNADQERTPDNQHLVAKSTDEAMGKLRDLLPEKRRKDAVLAVEYVMTASPEWFAKATLEQEKAFFQRSLQWLADKYGADRIVTASIHRDETTPHLSAFVVPLTKDKRLSAKEFIGSRDKMRADQSAYAACVANLGLERGIEGSKATHQTIQQHYAKVNQTKSAALPRITPEDLAPKRSRGTGLLGRVGLETFVETPEGIADRLNAKVAEATKAYRAKAAEASQARKEAQAARKALEDQQKALKPFLDALRPLNEAERKTLAAAMTVDSAKMVRKREELEQERKAELQRQREQRAAERKGKGFGPER